MRGGATRVDLNFEWDDEKAKSNLAKHGVHFEDAVAVFDDRQAVTTDGKTVAEETRHKRTGHADRSALITVVYAQRRSGETLAIRIISARAASRRERRIYGDRSIQAQSPE